MSFLGHTILDIETRGFCSFVLNREPEDCVTSGSQLPRVVVIPPP